MEMPENVEQDGRTRARFSGPRYRGSNPCLPARLRSPSASFVWQALGPSGPLACRSKRVPDRRSLSRRSPRLSREATKAGRRRTSSQSCDCRGRRNTRRSRRRLRCYKLHPHAERRSFLVVLSLARSMPDLRVHESKAHRYNLRSDVDPSRRYVGITNNLRERLSWHNAGLSGPRSIPPLVPPRLGRVPGRTSPVRFEKYLKTGSGRAFAKRHFGTW